jgi:hypothetical protein
MLRKQSFVDNDLWYDSSCAAEDYELWTRASKILKFHTLQEILGEYRESCNQITKSKKELLEVQHQQTVARSLKELFGIDVVSKDLILLASWYNPFTECSEMGREEREELVRRELKLLDEIRSRNKTTKALAPDALEFVLLRREAWTFGSSWMLDDPASVVASCKQKFRKINHISTVVDAAAKPSPVKKFLKAIMRPFYRPMRWRFVRPVEELGTQVIGLRAAIETNTWQVTSQIENSIKRIEERQQMLAHSLSESLKSTERDLLISIDKSANVAVERLQKTEERTLATIDERVWKVEEQLKSVIDGRVFKAEEQLRTITDARIWKAEEQLKATMDARIWSAEKNLLQKIDETADCESAVLVKEMNDLAYTDYQQLETRFKFLFINDTFNSFHHGCTATCLAIRKHFDELSDGRTASVPWQDICAPKVYPKSYQEFTSLEFKRKWELEYCKLVRLMALSERIAINGEGSMSNYHSGSLFLFYLIYYAAHFMKKDVSVINHSLYTSTYVDKLDDATKDDFLKIISTAYKDLKSCWIREPESLAQINKLIPNRGKLCFDCLPLYIDEIYQKDARSKRNNSVVISGGNYLGSWYGDFLKKLFPILRKRFGTDEYRFLFSDVPGSQNSGDRELYESLKEKLGDRVSWLSVDTTDQWLDAIASASLFISGRFHHTIASFMLDTPFFVFKTDTKKVEGMLKLIDRQSSLLVRGDAKKAAQQAEENIASIGSESEDSETKMRILRLAMNNFTL